MSFPRYKAGPVEYWLGEALTEFINGFISGLGGGGVVGVGMGATTAGTSLGSNITAWNQVMLAIASALLAAAGNGLKRVIVWHDQHPFPNPFPRPTGNTAVPFSNTAHPPSP